jgi:L-threonylcarbamoyladenylate synthase
VTQSAGRGERAALATARLSAASLSDLAQAAALLRKGGLVAFPTETVYGLGALALDPLAVRAIYAAKGRPATNPLIVHVPSVEAARALCAEWPADAQRLADAFWPGPLTLVLPRTALVPDEVTAGGPTVAVRVPAHPAALSLLQLVGAPIAAPSANRSEHVSPTSAAHVLADLDGRLDAVLDGGDCAVGIESTVVSLAHGQPRLLRAGGLSRAAIEALVGPLAGPASTATGAHASPGQHARHYAPAGTVRLEPGGRIAAALREIDAWGGVQCGVVLRGEATAVPALAAVVRLPADLPGYARGLYAALRTLEEQGCGALVLEEVPEGPEWEAVRDRLRRAAG